jgi:hypothetical protein
MPVEHIPTRSNPQGSLARHVGEAPMSETELMRRARDVYAGGRGVYFTPAQLKAMPEYSRRLIEAEARRLYG